MKILPAIDLLDNRVVRLLQGDYDKVTEYSKDPLSVAKEIRAMGFEDLHVVDLGGAKKGVPTAMESIRSFLDLGFELQVGGGIRSLETAEQYLGAGAQRVIVSTKALQNPSFFASLCRRYGSSRIMLSLDLRDGEIAVNGWQETMDRSLDSLLNELKVEELIVTDISRDGMLDGVHLDLYQNLIHDYPSIRITAAGGVSSMEVVRDLEGIGIHAAVVGRAFYECLEFQEELAACMK